MTALQDVAMPFPAAFPMEQWAEFCIALNQKTCDPVMLTEFEGSGKTSKGRAVRKQPELVLRAQFTRWLAISHLLELGGCLRTAQRIPFWIMAFLLS
jgi:hypothetical protein